MAKNIKSELAMRKALIHTIKKAETTILEIIDCASLYELDERQKKLQGDFQKFESKCMSIISMEVSNEFDENNFEIENDEIAELCKRQKLKKNWQITKVKRI